MAPTPGAISSTDPTSVKLALAIALLRFKNNSRPSVAAASDADTQRWKHKAKERKRELQKLREELKLLEDSKQCDALPQIASCRCHFFDGCGDSGGVGGSEHWIDDVLRRRFLRLIRWKERRKRVDGPIGSRRFLEFGNEDEIDRLSTSIDFLVELTDNTSGVLGSTFTTFSHQAVDFIIASMKNVLSAEKNRDLSEDIVNGMITRLTRRMCTITENDWASDSGSYSQFYVQHLMRKLGNEPFIGHHIMLSISQRISIVAESLLLMDPFDESFLANHDSLFMMIQLIEFLISDSLQNWSNTGDFDWALFEEWVRSVLRARKNLELLECRNGLYMLYIERVIGELAKQVGPLASQGKLESGILASLSG